MAYTKQTWVDNQTPADASHMNHIEEGIENVTSVANVHTNSISTLQEKINNLEALYDEINTDVQSLLSETKILCGVSKTIPTVSIPASGSSELISIDFSADLPANATLVGCELQTTPSRAFTHSGINIIGNSISMYFINLYSRAYNLTGATFILFYNISS